MLTCAIPVAARTTPLRGTPPQRLLSAAAKSHTTIVIVGVRVDGGWRAADARIPAKALAQRSRVAAAKERLLRKHRTAKRVEGRDYRNIPYFALLVDEHALRRLLDDDEVTSVGENSAFKRTLEQSTTIIGSATSNQNGYDGSQQTIAIVDDGVDHEHPFFGNRVIQDRAACFSGGRSADTSLCPGHALEEYGEGTGAPCVSPLGDDCPHGTKVAGIAAGKHPTNQDFFGVAPAAKILPVQVYSLTGNSTSGHQTNAYKIDVIAALEYLARADVRNEYDIAAVNLSIALQSNTNTRPVCISEHPEMNDAVSVLHELGSAVIAASGNAGGTSINVPACLEHAISVGATTDLDAVASYTDRPDYLDFFAPGGSLPGGGIHTSALGGGYIVDEGTSFAAPHVAGAFAVLREYAPQAPVGALESVLKAWGTTITGHTAERINVETSRTNIDVTAPTTPGSFQASGSTSSVSLTWNASTDAGLAHYEISCRDSRTATFVVVEQVTSGTSHTDSAVLGNRMYEYRIVAVDQFGNRSAEAKDFAVTVTFTEDPIPAPNPNLSSTITTIKGAHLDQLRRAVDAWREFALLSKVYTSYANATGPVDAAGFTSTTTSVVSALNEARTAMSLPSFSYLVTAPQPQGVVRREHVQELRNALK
ncbi:MAG TPA: S8 family serine peptidase [Thermoanaerobaculia bacterium]|nr:S8 family serine peptidase [Thermoanaerobaculia bacterium]